MWISINIGMVSCLCRLFHLLALPGPMAIDLALVAASFSTRRAHGRMLLASRVTWIMVATATSTRPVLALLGVMAITTTLAA